MSNEREIEERRKELECAHERKRALDAVFVIDNDVERDHLFEQLDSRLEQVDALLYFLGGSEHLGDHSDMQSNALWGVRILAESARVMAYKLAEDEVRQEKPKLVRTK